MSAFVPVMEALTLAVNSGSPTGAALVAAVKYFGPAPAPKRVPPGGGTGPGTTATAPGAPSDMNPVLTWFKVGNLVIGAMHRNFSDGFLVQFSVFDNEESPLRAESVRDLFVKFIDATPQLNPVGGGVVHVERASREFTVPDEGGHQVIVEVEFRCCGV